MSAKNVGTLSDSVGSHINTVERLSGKYGSLMDSIRRRAPEPLKCSLGCGGRRCKYCNADKWTNESMAVKGLFSHWITNDILATSRPIQEYMEKHSVIEEFKRIGIKSIINLQTAGEHSSCGPGLHESGFSYDPQEFMDNEIFFYNFGWDDYGVRSLQFLLDMVKVMAFAVRQGKVAVHCHAGMGRTGVLIASYLIYSQRMDGDNAVHFVRQKRPGSVQTSTQVEVCQQFAQFLIPLRMIFSVSDPRAFPFTLEQFLNRQKQILHGYEARELKHIPKLVYITWKRLLSLALNRDYKYQLKEDNYQIVCQTSPRAFQDYRTDLEHQSSSTADSSCWQDDEAGYSSATDSSSVSDCDTVLPLIIKRKMSVLLSKDGRVAEAECELAEGVARALAYDRTERRKGMSKEQEAALGIHRAVRHSCEAWMLTVGPRRRLDSFMTSSLCRIFGHHWPFHVFSVRVLEEAGMERQLEQRIKSLQENLNASSASWDLLVTEKGPLILATLMWSWFLHLKESVLNDSHVHLLLNTEDYVGAFKQLPRNIRHTIDFMINAFSKFPEVPPKVEDAVLGQMAEVMSFSVRERDSPMNIKKGLRKCFAAILSYKRSKRKSKP